jgi:hypothetical protein
MKPKQMEADFSGGGATHFRGLIGKPDFDWDDKPLRPLRIEALPSHLQAAHRLKCMRNGPSTLRKVKRQAMDACWTMERFEQEVERAIVQLAKDNAADAVKR